jgi:branched-chain amino acid transport system substrate-binding protein
VRSTRGLAFTLGVVLVVTAAACDSGDGSRAAPDRPSSTTTTTSRPAVDGALALGSLVPLSGPVAAIAPSFTAPVQLAVDEMNLAGGVNGRPVTLTFADDASNVDTARAALATLVDQNHVDAIVGPSSSEVAAAIMTDLPDRRIVTCSGSNSAGALSDIDSGGFYSRTAPPDRLQAPALARLVAGTGRRRPVILAPADAYGASFVDGLVPALRAAGATPSVVTVAPDADPSAVVTRALARNPDSVVLVGFPDGVAPLIKALAAVGKGPNQLPTYGTDGLQTADLGALVDPANPAVVAGLTGTTPAGAPAGIDHPFNARMLATGVEPFFSASAYDCAILIGLAAVAAKSDDADEIRTHFATNLRGPVSCSTFAECATALKAGRRIHYRGAFSAYDRWRGTEPGTGVYDAWTMGIDARPTLSPPSGQIPAP